jgi:hypothetical protein
MYKLISLLRRKPGLSKAEFKTYYETSHVKFGEKHLRPECVKYSRRYLTQIVSPMKPDNELGPDYDCQVEFWFVDEAAYKRFEARVAGLPEAERAAIVQDEENFLDRDRTYRYLVDESISWQP